ncbi:MAG: NAD(+) synthase, partial [Myxococcales bacterium]|nr:NAD(+) synthase [Myxococcales bacterium]
LALLDYLEKAHMRGFAISLSGGADSAAVTLLIQQALGLARLELGADRLNRRLGRPADMTADALMADLVTTVYQATRNSGDVTLTAARAVAEAAGARFAVIDIDALVQDYVARAESVLGRKLTWETDDIALQNIQARVRAPGIWLVANVEQKLLLATSNRSEAAVGYATMDGDTCGGLSPITGVDKAFLRQWLAWLETEGTAELGPVPALSFINRQQPTAELRPQSESQTDESDLMPYPVLDAIERAAIGDHRDPADIYLLMQRRFPQYPAETMRVWVARFFRLFAQNQWKRERYAPSFHVDDENMDPKTWCRFPILNGGFRRELAELRGAP